MLELVTHKRTIPASCSAHSIRDTQTTHLHSEHVVDIEIISNGLFVKAFLGITEVLVTPGVNMFSALVRVFARASLPWRECVVVPSRLMQDTQMGFLLPALDAEEACEPVDAGEALDGWLRIASGA